MSHLYRERGLPPLVGPRRSEALVLRQQHVGVGVIDRLREAPGAPGLVPVQGGDLGGQVVLQQRLELLEGAGEELVEGEELGGGGGRGGGRGVDGWRGWQRGCWAAGAVVGCSPSLGRQPCP